MSNICNFSSKKEISEESKEQISHSFFKSHDFLYPSFLSKSIEFQNNIEQLNSINECLLKSERVNKIIRGNNENENNNYDNIYPSFYDMHESNNIIATDISYIYVLWMFIVKIYFRNI